VVFDVVQIQMCHGLCLLSGLTLLSELEELASISPWLLAASEEFRLGITVVGLDSLGCADTTETVFWLTYSELFVL